MNHNRLELFLRVVALGSVSAAAKSAYLTQPALSHNLKLLETEVGTPLFARQGRRLQLTAAGRALAVRARALLDLDATFKLEVSRIANRGYFDLRLGCIDSVATYLLPRVVYAMRSAFPDLVLKLFTARTTLLLEHVQAGKVDMAVVAHSGTPRDIEAWHIGRYDLQFYGLKTLYPTLAKVTNRQGLRQFPVVEIEPGPGTDKLIPEDSLSYALASNVATVKALALSGLGVGDLPTFIPGKNDLRKLVQAKIPHDPHCGLFLLRSQAWSGKTATVITQKFCGLLKERFG